VLQVSADPVKGVSSEAPEVNAAPEANVAQEANVVQVVHKAEELRAR
jgi:hypothetical protein